jgi:hypothetical protein
VVIATLQVWSSEVLREQFLALPLPAVRCLLASEAASVAAENTALVALAGWVEEGQAGRAATPAQRSELLSMVSDVPVRDCVLLWWAAVCVSVGGDLVSWWASSWCVIARVRTLHWWRWLAVWKRGQQGALRHQRSAANC